MLLSLDGIEVCPCLCVCGACACARPKAMQLTRVSFTIKRNWVYSSMLLATFLSLTGYRQWLGPHCALCTLDRTFKSIEVMTYTHAQTCCCFADDLYILTSHMQNMECFRYRIK